MEDLPQWLHLLLRAKRTLNSLLHFLQAGSEPTNSGGGPLRSGRPLGVLMVECGQGLWDNGVTKNLIGETARWYFVFPPALTRNGHPALPRPAAPHVSCGPRCTRRPRSPPALRLCRAPAAVHHPRRVPHRNNDGGSQRVRRPKSVAIKSLQ